MKQSTKDKTEGKMHQVKGAIEEGIGIATDNHELEVKGKIETIKGKVQEKVGSIEKVLGK